MDIVATAIAGAAVIGSGGAVWFARGAVIQARRSADAAVAVARIEQDRRAHEVAEAERQWVRFELQRLENSRYALRHVGTRSAYGVHVDTAGSVPPGAQMDFDEFVPGEEQRYTLRRDLIPHIEVSWHLEADRSDERRSQKLSVV